MKVTTRNHQLKIWLSRYSNRKAIQKHNLIPVSITVGNPRWPLGYEIADEVFFFEPTGRLFHIENKDEMRIAMFNKLKGREAEIKIILDNISIMHDERDIVLLCYEDVRKSDEWCHRQIIGEWLETQGYEVSELEDLTKPPPIQYDLQI